MKNKEAFEMFIVFFPFAIIFYYMCYSKILRGQYQKGWHISTAGFIVAWLGLVFVYFTGQVEVAARLALLGCLIFIFGSIVTIKNKIKQS